MPYREPTDDALEARLGALLDARRMLDIDIAATRRLLRPLRIRDRLRVLRIVGLCTGVAGIALAALVFSRLPRVGCGRGIDHTRTDAQSVRSAAVMYVSENAGGDCPAVNDLTKGGYLDRSRRTVDEWDHPFVVECEGDDILVISAGPDGELDTEDDIR